MTDLHTRFRTLDDLQAPDLWSEVQARALAAQQRGVRTLPWVLIAVILLLALAIGGAALIGSGIVHPIRPPAWTATGGMIEARVGHTATLLPDGKVLAAGGGSNFTGLSILASAELYDPRSGSWTATGNMATDRQYHTATLLPSGKVLVAGGGDSDVLASAELYDPSSGSWTATGSMIEARAGQTATLLPDGKVLAAGGGGGTSSGEVLASAEVYDPSSGSWTATGNMIEARAGQTATLLPNGKVLVAGGFSNNSSALASAELYDPSRGTWTATGTMAGARWGHTATLLPDGTLLVAGGSPGGRSYFVALSTAELYDPRSGSWTATGNMATDRQYHTATLLPSGKVLATGGVGSRDRVSTAELYDPGSGSWTATANMHEVRFGHTATLLPDGKVLVAGFSAELYDPGSGT